jgi:hypothetical protein
MMAPSSVRYDNTGSYSYSSKVLNDGAPLVYGMMIPVAIQGTLVGRWMMAPPVYGMMP